MAIYAIGDIHGSLTALSTLIEAVDLSAEDTIVTLGDYVDRGPDSRGCIDYLLDLKKRHQLVCLRGNHEVMMIEAAESSLKSRRWEAVGGRATLKSYDAADVAGIPESHWEFFKATLPFFETEKHIFVHAGLDPHAPMGNQSEWDLYWEFFDRPAPHESGKVMICGHSSQKSGVPLSYGHAICIDTYIYGGGWLTCLDVEANTYIQANQKGELRRDVIELTEVL